MNVVPFEDGAMTKIEAWVEDKIIDLRKDFAKVRGIPFTVL